MKILTIIVPAYNMEDYIAKNIESVVGSKKRDKIELIIVNDGSTDYTLRISEQYRAQYKDTIVIVNKENGGHGSAINAGARVAMGKYMKVVDGDDWVDTNELDLLIEKLEDTDADLVLCPYTMHYMKTDRREKVELKNLQKEQVMPISEKIKEVGFFYSLHSITFKTEVFQKVEYSIDEDCFYVDMEYSLYPVKYLKTLVYIRANVYQYRMERLGQSVAMTSKIKNRDMHFRVIDSLIKKYYRCGELESELERFVTRHIVSLINTQYSILLSMPISVAGHEEIMHFRDYTGEKVNSKDLYKVSLLMWYAPFLYIPLAVYYRMKYMDA